MSRFTHFKNSGDKKNKKTNQRNGCPAWPRGVKMNVLVEETLLTPKRLKEGAIKKPVHD